MKNSNNTSKNLMLNCHCKDTLNEIKFLSKGLKHCEPISGNLLVRMIEIITNSNTVSI